MSDFKRLLVNTAIPCREVDPELFFVNDGDTEENRFQIARAKSICGTCPIRFECLQFALETEDGHGIMGGMTPAERQVLQSRAAA